MTTQVVLLNALGIAMASDSAVTAGGKVLNTSEKIFELPAPHRLAVLTSGRARFMGIPWEVALSAWSETLDKPLNSVQSYLESLYKFLRTIFPTGGSTFTQDENDYLRSSYWGTNNTYDTINQILGRVVTPHFEDFLDGDDRDAFFSNEPWDETFRERMSAHITPEIVEQMSKELVEAADNRRNLYVAAAEASEAQALVWIDKYWSQYEVSPSDSDYRAWPAIPGFDSMIKRLWATFVVHADYDGESNVNLFGFGSGDMFPSGAGTFMHGLVNGTLIKRFEGNAEAVSEPRYYFFGQSDAITAMVSGEDHLLISAAEKSSQKTLNDIYDRLLQSEDAEVALAREYVKETLDKGGLAEEMKRAGSEERGKPFRKAIGMSPILDLAEFAAQLVGVQAASAAMTQENPSVGGFVDVAIISHRRGFEWIRHKQH